MCLPIISFPFPYWSGGLAWNVLTSRDQSVAVEGQSIPDPILRSSLKVTHTTVERIILEKPLRLNELGKEIINFIMDLKAFPILSGSLRSFII